MKCKKCGLELPDYAKFCAYCGEKQENKNKEEAEGIYAFGMKIEGKKMIDFYVGIIEQILMRYPELIGAFEPIITSDMERAEKYLGNTRYIEIDGRKIAINANNSTNAKKDNIKRLMAAAGISPEEINF